MILVPRVHRLSVQLANQIAAGEVVERPASVLKELLENSLDAGATNIRVDIEGGGSRLIRVQDDGCGIHRDDLQLAVSRHATSKIGSLADLEQLCSMGFRGEALASIASVSRCRLVSRSAEMDTGWGIEVAGSEELGEISPWPHPPGTTVEVRDLFFNTPARRRFLRSERTEMGHLEAVFKRVALSRFDTAFTLKSAQRTIHRLQGAREQSGRERRLVQLCGKGFMAHAVHLQFEMAGVTLHGWVATPDFARSQTDMQYFYLNGRTIRDRLVNHAIRQAYEGSLYEGRHPAYVLFLEMDPAQVDVNVHPTKHEVRFREARLVHDFLLASLQQALAGGGSRLPVQQGIQRDVTLPRPTTSASSGTAEPHPRVVGVKEQIAAYRQLHEPAAARTKGKSSCALGDAVAVLFDRYLLSRRHEQLLLIDICRMRELLFRERLRSALEEGGGMATLPLLLPVQVVLEEAQYMVWEENREPLSALGFDIGTVGPGSLVVRRIPRPLRICDADTLLPSLLQSLSRQPDGKQDLVALVAHHAASAVTRREELSELTLQLRDLCSVVQQPELHGLYRVLEREYLERLFR